MGFASWNERLLEYFFGDFAAGQQVRLAVSRDLLDGEFADLGGAEEFLRVVRHGPDWPVVFDARHFEWSQPHSLLDRATGLYSQWRRRTQRHKNYIELSSDGPPYLLYLCLLCYAWTVEDEELAGHNFYDRLAIVYPCHGLNNQLGRFTELWNGLAEWTEQRDGKVGSFVREQLGGMPYVGIPRAQVILTASKVEHLPMLFRALALGPGLIIGEQTLRDVIISHPGASQHFLGRNVWEAIIKDEPIGKSAIDQLLQHHAEWDGWLPDSPERAGGGGGGGGSGHGARTSLAGRLLLALEPTMDNERWLNQIFLRLDGWPTGTLRFRRGGHAWITALIDAVGGPVVREDNGESLDGALWTSQDQDEEVNGVWTDETEGERSVVLRWRHRMIMVLAWHEQTLVEQPELPGEGDAYLLIHQAAERNWEVWRRGLPQSGRVNVTDTLTQRGLPARWRLIHIGGLASINDEHWARFPDGSEEYKGRPRVLRTMGGSRARRAGARKTYLSYDPPKVVLEAEGDVRVEAAGAHLVEHARQGRNAPAWARLETEASFRVFSVAPLETTAIVSVWAVRDGHEIDRVLFGLARDDNEIAAAPVGDFRVDNLGETSSNPHDGALGLIIPGVGIGWDFFNGPYTRGLHFEVEAALNRPCFQFLEWLANAGRAPFARARDMCVQLLGAEASRTSPTREVRAMCQLGHLELQLDRRGRWATVHATPCSLYVLPLCREDKYQVVVGGAFTRAQLSRIVRTAGQMGLRVESQSQLGDRVGYWLVPPRLCLVGEDLEQFAALSRECGINWDPVPSALRVAHWVGSLDDWLRGLSWYPEVGPEVEATYRPCEFQTRDGDEWPNWGGYKLGRLDDPVTNRHFSYILIRRQNETFHHAYSTQKAWGCWHVHREVMQGLMVAMRLPPLAAIPIAYDSDARTVVLPVELNLPMLLSRALVLCSGFAPTYVTAEQYAAYAHAQHGFTPGSSYRGRCLAYRDVPQQIARRVLQNVGADIQFFPPLPAMRL